MWVITSFNIHFPGVLFHYKPSRYGGNPHDYGTPPYWDGESYNNPIINPQRILY